MKKLFTPAMIIMSKLRYIQKFSALFIITLIPLVTLSYYMINTISSDISFLEDEIIGVQYLQAARLPMQHIQQHRGMTAAYLNGATQFKERIASKRLDVDKYLQQLQQVEKKLGGKLDLTGSTNQLLQQWNNIKENSLQQKTAKAIQMHSNLVSDILEIMLKAANRSKLALDPHFDSKHIGTALTTTLPNLMENMGKGRAVGSGIAGAGKFNKTNFVSLSVLANNISTYSKQLKLGLDSAVTSNGDIKNSLGSMIQNNNDAVSAISTMLKKDLLEPEVMTISGEKVYDTATKAINGSYELFDAMAPELTAIINKRIDKDIQIETVAFSIVAGLLLLLFYLFVGLYYSIMDNISLVGKATQSMSEGDLATRLALHGNDEMQQVATDFNAMANKFESLVKSISHATIQLSAAAEEVSCISKESSANLENQRDETKQVAVAINEMAAKVQVVAQNAGEASSAADNADNEAKSGNRIVSNATTSIDKLASEVESTANIIDQVAKDSNDIGSVLEVIKSIADQTNLLALNAAIEAARAGEQGRGFAVVADEVRTLAGRTQEATQEIESMVEKLQNAAKNAVSAMETGQEQAKIGVVQTREASDALQAITDAVSTINQMNTQIANASEDQSATVEQIESSIKSINQLAEQTSTSALQSTESSDELSQLAVNLQSMVSQFKVG